MSAPPPSIRWEGDPATGRLILLDQRRLPGAEIELAIVELEELREAILGLAVRGAPAIGIAAAYGLAQAAGRAAAAAGPGATSEAIGEAVHAAAARLRSSRPTAVNLMWALDRLRDCFDHHAAMLDAEQSAARLLMEARRIHREDAELCRRIAEHGAALLPRSGGIYTHCNTGSLATGGVGTAIGCMRQAVADGARVTIYAGETRPLLQGARLTAWELQAAGCDVRLCCDSMAGHLMRSGAVDAVIVGADRITARGDVANKIGTYQLAVLARHHDIPFLVAAPSTTFDLAIEDGDAIEIEQRPPDEVRAPMGVAFAPADIPVVNPAFDVTPAELVSALITEHGVIREPSVSAIRRLIGDHGHDVPAV